MGLSRGIVAAVDLACDECDLARNDPEYPERLGAKIQNAPPSIAQLAGIQNALPPQLHREAIQTSYRNSRFRSRVIEPRHPK